MPSFGEKLKLEREKRKISLDQISASTKIGTRMLQALEEEKFNQLPGGIFNKGFVRAYARAVGLDEDQTVVDYLEASGDSLPARPELVTRESSAREEEEHRISRLEAISESPSRPLPWGAFAVILLVIALALSLWSHRRREEERLAAHTAPAKTALQTAVAPAPPQNTTTSASGSAAESSPVGSGAAATPAPGEFMVVIQAREQSWIASTVDGKSTPSEILEPGSERILRGHQEVVVKAGNAGGLDFRLNGKKLEVGGDLGQVKTVTIGPAGLVSNAPVPPTTP